MRIKLIKGKFTITEDYKGGAKITCNICTKLESSFQSQQDEEHHREKILTMPLPGATELGKAKTALQESNTGQTAKLFGQSGSGTRSLAAIDAQLKSGSQNAMKPMFVAPLIFNGRPMGLQPIMCFYCRQIGLVNCEPERTNPAYYGVVVTSLNEIPRAHAIQRAKVSYAVLLCLDYLCGLTTPDGIRLIPSSAHIVCPGSSIQTAGKSGGNKQDAHQVLREITINGETIYDLAHSCPTVPDAMKRALVYCNATISHLDAIYNQADGLVESAIVIDFIELAQQVVSGRIREGTTHDSVFRRYLWRLLIIRYFYACRIALINAAGDSGLEDAIHLYLVEVSAMKNSEPPDFVNVWMRWRCAANFLAFIRS